MTPKPIAILYEHPYWFEDLFKQLETDNFPYEKIYIPNHDFDLFRDTQKYDLFLNRMSALPFDTNTPNLVFYVQEYLKDLESQKVNVINGSTPFGIGLSKVRQQRLISNLGLCTPKTRVIHNKKQLKEAVVEIGFPLLLKPNIGGSGKGIQKCMDNDAFLKIYNDNEVQFGIDGILLVQEYIPPEEGYIVRVEVLNDMFLYALKVPVTSDSFNLCPADYCQAKKIEEGYCTLETATKFEKYSPPKVVIDEAIAIIKAAQASLGSVEYLISKTGQRIYYDLNPLSNFVFQAPDLLGFNPTQRLVSFLKEQ
jgi:hypothetical protein